MVEVSAALAYASRGWAVLPVYGVENGLCACGKPDCGSPAKHPRTPQGLKDASTDPEVIQRWWSEWPDSNVGIATGPMSGIVVVDIDTKENGIENWSDLRDIHGNIDTLTATTGSGGTHVVLKLNGHQLRNTAGLLASGIDTRGEGGYIVAPPSIHISGEQYVWDDRKKPIAYPPDWLVKLWAPDVSNNVMKSEASNEPNWVSQSLKNGVPEGSRNSTAIKLAAYFAHRGLRRDEIEAILLEQFNPKCYPPLSDREVLTTIDSGMRYSIQVANAGISNPPYFEEKAGVLYYRWEYPGVEIAVEQLHRNKQGLNAMITINDINEGKIKDVIGPVMYNLTSSSGRNTIMKTLTDRWSMDWSEILQNLSRLCNEYIRHGQDVVDLRDYVERPWNKWALSPLMLDDQPTMLFGTGGLGKSMVGLAAMLSLNTNTILLPGMTPEPGHKGIYLDWESTAYEHGGRFRQLMNGVGLNHRDHPTAHLTCVGTLAEIAPQLHRKFQDEGITFCIIDSAGLACGGEAEKAESALSFFGALRVLKVPALIIAHLTKGDNRQMPFGSVFWHNSARSTFEIKNQQSVGNTNLSIGLFQRKSNVGRLEKPYAYDLLFSEDNSSIKFESVNIHSVPELAAETTTIEKIRDYLSHLEPNEEGKMVGEIAEGTGVHSNTVSTTLKRYQGKRGGVIQVRKEMGNIIWGLEESTSGT